MIIKNNIKTIVTDGFIPYPKILEELEIEHKKCNFHKMQNFINQIKGTIRGLKNKKIKENEEKK